MKPFRTSYTEKRSYHRMTVRCPATVSDAVSGEVIDAVCVNLSGAGVLLETGREFAVGTRLHVHIAPEGTFVPPLDAEIEVIRSQPATGRDRHEIAARVLHPSG